MSDERKYRVLMTDFGIFPILRTQRLTLREVTDADRREMLELRSHPRVMQYIDRPFTNTETGALELIRKIRQSSASGDGITWGISVHDDPKMIGTMGFWRIDKPNFRAEIGYMLHPDYHGKQLMSEAMKAALSYAFDVMHLHSVEANVNPANEASIRLLEKHGFVKEAHFRENYYFDGKFLDSAIYSLVPGLT